MLHKSNSCVAFFYFKTSMHDYFKEINIPSVQIPKDLFNRFETIFGNNRIESVVTSGILR